MSHDVTNFQTEVIERSRSVPVLVDFWAAWCGPCRMLGPVLEKLAGESNGRWVLAKVDTEVLPDVAGHYGVMSIPSVKLFVDGQVVDEFVGAIPEPQVRRWLEHAIPSAASGLAKQVSEWVARGRFKDAEALVAKAPADQAREPDVRAALAAAKLHTDPSAVPELVTGLEDDPRHGDRIRALLALAALTQLLDHADKLPDQPERGRFLAALEAIRAGDWGVALEALIDVLRGDRKFAGGAAREAVRAIFVMLGPGDPMVEQYHRAYSSAVNV